MKAPALQSQRLLYKPLSLEHLSERYVAWMNDPEVIRYMEAGGDYTLDKLKSFLADAEKKNILFWGIHLKDNGKHIGNIKIDPVLTRHGVGEYGIMMGDRSEWGKGFAKEATLAIIDFCFKQAGIRKITLGVIEKNKIAVKLYQSIGFITEGVYKDHGYYNGELCDVFRMALFNPEMKK